MAAVLRARGGGTVRGRGRGVNASVDPEGSVAASRPSNRSAGWVATTGGVLRAAIAARLAERFARWGPPAGEDRMRRAASPDRCACRIEGRTGSTGRSEGTGAGAASPSSDCRDAIRLARTFEPADVAGATAMRENGFTEADISLAFGRIPPDLSPEEFVEAFDEEPEDAP